MSRPHVVPEPVPFGCLPLLALALGTVVASCAIWAGLIWLAVRIFG